MRPEVKTGGGGGGAVFSIAGDGTVLKVPLLEAEAEELLGMLLFLCAEVAVLGPDLGVTVPCWGARA